MVNIIRILSLTFATFICLGVFVLTGLIGLKTKPLGSNITSKHSMFYCALRSHVHTALQCLCAQYGSRNGLHTLTDKLN